MKCRYLSDPHTDIQNVTVPPSVDDASSTIIIAGDLGQCNPITCRTIMIDWIRELASRFKYVVFVLGNHDYWKGSVENVAERLAQELEDQNMSNVFLLDGSSVELDGVVFVGGTLWTAGDNNPLASVLFKDMMREQQQIRCGDGHNPNALPFTFERAVVEHKRCLQALIDCTITAKAQGKPVVWVTHHGVTGESRDYEYYTTKLDILATDNFYITELTPVIQACKPDYIVHGHTHQTKQYTVDCGDAITHVLINARGRCTRYIENENFNPYAHFHVGI